MKNLIVYCLLCLLLLVRVCSAQEKPTVTPYLSRSAFAAKMAKVEQGMTQEQVKTLLGPPDAVKGNNYGEDSWLYGVAPKSECPTLGIVQFNQDKQVSEVIGNTGEPPPESLISEGKLRELLELLWRLRYSPENNYSFDPLLCIKTVNILHPYGKECVLAVANEYLRVCEQFGKGDIALTVLLLSFQPATPDTFHPTVALNNLFPPWPADKSRVPRYPFALREDVPLYLVYGGPSGSYDFSTNEYTQQLSDYLKKHGRLRKSLLRPPDDPLGILDSFAASDQWLFGKDYPVDDSMRSFTLTSRHPNEEEEGKMLVRHQLLRLVRSVFPASSPYRAYLKENVPRIDSKQWQELCAELSKLSIHWNPKINDYQAN